MDTSMPSRIDLYDEPFAIIEQDTIDRRTNKIIGKVEIKDSGFSKNCDYEMVRDLAKKEALKLGGNCLVITDHKQPDLGSTCHRIKADVFLVDDPRYYESEIFWSENRKLRIADFKGAPDAKDNLAFTVAGVKLNVLENKSFPDKYEVVAKTYFNCRDSYFNRSALNTDLLAQQQVHFDITELYTRKFLQEIEASNDLDQLLANYEALVIVQAEKTLEKREEYTSAIQEDESQLEYWQNWVGDELRKYEKYAERALVDKK